MKLSILKHRKIVQATAGAVLIGLMIYGAVGRARISGSKTLPPPPSHDSTWKASGGVKARATLSQTKVLRGSDGLVYLQIEMTAPERRSEATSRKPTDFVVVLDRSGSMADARKMEYAQRAVGSLIRQFREGDRFALVGFDSRVEIPVPLTEVTAAAKDRFLLQLSTLTPRDATNLGAGLVAGIDEIRRTNRSPGRAQRLILLSDGLANEGITDPQSLNQIAARAVGGTFAISTIGVGLDFNENLLASLADFGRGNYHFLETLASLDSVLAREFAGASQIVAGDLKVRFDLDPEIEVVDASGYPIEREGTGQVVRPGHLYGGQVKTLFITLRLPTDRVYTKELGRAGLSYEIEGTPYRVDLLDSSLKVACLPPERQEDVTASIERNVFQKAWTENNYGRLLRDNADQVKAGNQPGALGAIQAYRTKLEEAYAAAPAPEMKEKLDELRNVEKEVANAFTGDDQAAKVKRLSKGYQSQGLRSQRGMN